MERSWSRRELLRFGAATTGLGVAGSLAGCGTLSESLPSDSENTEDETAEPEDEVVEGAYESWLVDPTTVGESDHYGFRYDNYEKIRDNEGEFDAAVYSEFEDERLASDLNIAFEDIDDAIYVDSLVTTQTPSILLGEFAKDTVGNTLTGDEYDFEAQQDIDEYTIYVSSTTAVGVKEGGLIASTGTNPSDDVSAVIDTAGGEADPYGETNDDMTELLGQFGEDTFVSGETMEPVETTDLGALEIAGQVGWGARDVVNGGTIDTKMVFLFEDVTDVDMDAVSALTDQDSFQDYNSILSVQNGRSAVVTGEIDTSDFER